MKYIIYQTTGKNRILLGIHKVKDDKFDGYLGDGVQISNAATFMYPKTPFQHAVKQYGTSSFYRKTLYTYNSYKDAFYKLKELLTDKVLEDSTYFNMFIPKPGVIYQFDKDGKLRKTWDNIIEVSDFYCYPMTKFQLAISNKFYFLNSYWSNTSTIDVNEYTTKYKNSVYLYNKAGKLIDEFPYKEDCAEYLGVSLDDIKEAIKTQTLLKNYYVSESVKNIFKPKPRVTLKYCTFYVYDSATHEINSSKGKGVFKLLGMHSWKKLHNAINLNNGWYLNKYVSTSEITEIPIKPTSHKKIGIYDEYGNLIEEMTNIKEFMLKYQITKSMMAKITKGCSRFNDYIFKYSK